MSIARSIIIAVIPLLAIIALLAGYLHYYRRKINEHVSDENYQIRSIISPTSLALILLGLFMIINTTGNRAQLNNLQQKINQLNNSVINLQNTVNDLTRDQDEYPYQLNLSTESVYKEDGQYYFLENIEVIPEKGRSDDRITLFVNGNEVELVPDKNSYKAVFSLPTDSTNRETSLLIETGDQQLRRQIYLGNEKLLQLLQLGRVI